MPGISRRSTTWRRSPDQVRTLAGPGPDRTGRRLATAPGRHLRRAGGHAAGMQPAAAAACGVAPGRPGAPRRTPGGSRPAPGSAGPLDAGERRIAAGSPGPRPTGRAASGAGPRARGAGDPATSHGGRSRRSLAAAPRIARAAAGMVARTVAALPCLRRPAHARAVAGAARRARGQCGRGAQRARTGGAGADRPGVVQPGDQRAAVHLACIR